MIQYRTPKRKADQKFVCRCQFDIWHKMIWDTLHKLSPQTTVNVKFCWVGLGFKHIVFQRTVYCFNSIQYAEPNKYNTTIYYSRVGKPRLETARENGGRENCTSGQNNQHKTHSRKRQDKQTLELHRMFCKKPFLFGVWSSPLFGSLYSGISNLQKPPTSTPLQQLHCFYIFPNKFNPISNPEPLFCSFFPPTTRLCLRFLFYLLGELINMSSPICITILNSLPAEYQVTFTDRYCFHYS